MNTSLLSPVVCYEPLLSIYSRVKRSLVLLTGASLLMCAGITQAAPFGAGLAIENDMDSNGNITVINGGKVKVTFAIDDPDKLSNKADKIQLVRVNGDNKVVSSVARGKKKNGTVSLVVKKSENEKLYVRYLRKGKDGEEITRVSHPDDDGFIPLMSIPRASVSELTRSVNALESAPLRKDNIYKITRENSNCLAGFNCFAAPRCDDKNDIAIGGSCSFNCQGAAAECYTGNVFISRGISEIDAESLNPAGYNCGIRNVSGPTPLTLRGHVFCLSVP